MLRRRAFPLPVRNSAGVLNHYVLYTDLLDGLYELVVKCSPVARRADWTVRLHLQHPVTQQLLSSHSVGRVRSLRRPSVAQIRGWRAAAVAVVDVHGSQLCP